MTADPTSTVQVRYSPVERIRVEAMALNTTWQVRVGAWEGLLHSPRSRKVKRTWRFFAPDHFVEEKRGRATIASHARRADGIEVHDWWFEFRQRLHMTTRLMRPQPDGSIAFARGYLRSPGNTSTADILS